MNTEIKGVHVEITDAMREYVDKKMHRLDFAREHLVDLLFSFAQEKKGQYKAEVNINFRWGNSTHVGVDAFDIFEGIDKLFDKMELKIIKEKKKIQDHKGQESVRGGEPAEEDVIPGGRVASAGADAAGEE